MERLHFHAFYSLLSTRPRGTPRHISQDGPRSACARHATLCLCLEQTATYRSKSGSGDPSLVATHCELGATTVGRAVTMRCPHLRAAVPPLLQHSSCSSRSSRSSSGRIPPPLRATRRRASRSPRSPSSPSSRKGVSAAACHRRVLSLSPQRQHLVLATAFLASTLSPSEIMI